MHRDDIMYYYFAKKPADICFGRKRPSCNLRTQVASKNYAVMHNFHLCKCLQAFEELEKLLKKRNICVAVKEKLTKDSGVDGSDKFNHIVENLLAKPKAKGNTSF